MIIVVIYLVIIMLFGIIKKVNCFASFEKGAEFGMQSSYRLFPSFLALVFAINVLINSGITTLLIRIICLPIIAPELLIQMLLRPLSANSALIMMNKIIQQYQVDSRIAKISALIQGSSDTTFYIVMVYFGSVKITKIRYTLKAGLLTDLLTFIIAYLLGMLFL